MSGVLAVAARELIESACRSVVAVGHGRGYGTGVIWDASGWVVTNDHVASERQAMVELADGRRIVGQVVARDRRNDLALIQVPAPSLRAIKVGESERLRIGEVVVALGHPLGLKDVATMGIVSGKGEASWMGKMRRDLVQLDVSLAPGNSGGPILNADGQMIGMACMIASPGIALAIPSELIDSFVKEAERSLRKVA